MNKHYAIADIHGNYNLFNQVRKYLDSSDICYVLGDCADRGSDGWRIIKEIVGDEKFIYLKGNHEDMLIEAMEGDTYLLFLNGGACTYEDWLKEQDYNFKWQTILKKLSLKKRYINKDGKEIILCHAGYTPHQNVSLEKDDYLWNREHFNTPWDEDFKNTYIIHGHTSLTYFNLYCDNYVPTEEVKAFWYSEDSTGVKHKVNIDCGTAATKKLILLDLDTFEEKVFSEN